MNNKTTINTLLALLAIVTVFHLAIIAKLIPYEIAWGGRIQNDSAMYVFETLSILINLFLGLILLMKGSYLKFRFSEKIINIVLWVYLVIFILNTMGNLFAKTNFEKLFSILTLLFALLIWRILGKHKADSHHLTVLQQDRE